MRHFYDMGTCLSLQITFFGRTFGIAIHFYRRTFSVCIHFYGRTFEPKKAQTRRKHEKKDEENTKDTRNFAYFSSKQRTKSSDENSPLIYEKSVV